MSEAPILGDGEAPTPIEGHNITLSGTAGSSEVPRHDNGGNAEVVPLRLASEAPIQPRAAESGEALPPVDLSDQRQHLEDTYDLRRTNPEAYRATVARMDDRARNEFEAYAETRDKKSGLPVVQDTEENAWVKELYAEHRRDPSTRLGLTPDEQRTFDTYAAQRERLERGVSSDETEIVDSLRAIARERGTDSAEYSLALSRAARVVSPQTYSEILTGEKSAPEPPEPEPSVGGSGDVRVAGGAPEEGSTEGDEASSRGKPFVTGDHPVAGEAASDEGWTPQRARGDGDETGRADETRPDIPVYVDDDDFDRMEPQETPSESSASRRIPHPGEPLPLPPIPEPPSEPEPGRPVAGREDGPLTPEPEPGSRPEPEETPQRRGRLRARVYTFLGNTLEKIKDHPKATSVLGASAVALGAVWLATKGMDIDLNPLNNTSSDTTAVTERPPAPRSAPPVETPPPSLEAKGPIIKVPEGGTLTGVLEEMGIPKDRWQDVITDPGVQEALLDTNDGYLTEGDPDNPGLNYFGEDTKLHEETIRAINEAAGIDTPSPTPLDANGADVAPPYQAPGVEDLSKTGPMGQENGGFGMSEASAVLGGAAVLVGLGAEVERRRQAAEGSEETEDSERTVEPRPEARLERPLPNDEAVARQDVLKLRDEIAAATDPSKVHTDAEAYGIIVNTLVDRYGDFRAWDILRIAHLPREVTKEEEATQAIELFNEWVHQQQ